jgi:hypothetical protein
MANARGQYGKNGETRVGGELPPHVGYVERESSSILTWIIGTIAVGGAVLWARHQSKQIGQLYKMAGLPQQSFGADLRQSAKAIPARTSAALHDLAERVRPTKKNET